MGFYVTHVAHVGESASEPYPGSGEVMWPDVWPRSQNHPARSTVTPFSLRGKARPAVAAPRQWGEIGPGLAQLGPDEVGARLEELGGPLSDGERA